MNVVCRHKEGTEFVPQQDKRIFFIQKGTVNMESYNKEAAVAANARRRQQNPYLVQQALEERQKEIEEGAANPNVKKKNPHTKVCR